MTHHCPEIPFAKQVNFLPMEAGIIHPQKMFLGRFAVITRRCLLPAMMTLLAHVALFLYLLPRGVSNRLHSKLSGVAVGGTA